MTNTETKETQIFLLNDGKLKEKTEVKEIEVYFNGSPVFEGDVLIVQTLLSETSLAVEGVENYDISTSTVDNTTTYTITNGDGKTFVFSVKADIAEAQAASGCMASTMTATFAVVAAAVAAMVIMLFMNDEKTLKQPKTGKKNN